MYQITKAKKLADKIYLMDVVAPRVAANCLPGQFIIAKVDKEGERIPLTICDYDREKGTITIVFQIVGASTEKMSKLVAGDSFTEQEVLIRCRWCWCSTCLPTGKVAA